MRTLLILFTFAFSFPNCVQMQEDEIKKAVNDYFSLLQELKISEALDYVHPDLLAMIGKETYEQQYNAMFQDANMTVTFGALTINSVSEVFKSSAKGDFSLLDYQFVMNYELKFPTQEAKDTFANTLKGQFGEDNFKRDGDKLEVTASREMFVNSRSDFEGWRILDYEAGMRMILVGIISEEVLSHFNK